MLAWGCNSHGQLGFGDREDYATPSVVRGLSDVVAVACGNLHSVALTSHGEVFGWGFNAEKSPTTIISVGAELSSSVVQLVAGGNNAGMVVGT